jgi:hypothetical protein
MQFLTVYESIKLVQTLSASTLLQTAGADDRWSLLALCDLDRHCKNIVLDAPIEAFVRNLCIHLSKVYVSDGSSEKPGIIVFLECISLMDNTLSSDAKQFFDHVIQKWKRCTSSDQKRQRTDIAQLLAQAERQQIPSVRTQKKVKIDKNIIISYNLETEMYTFRKELGYEGAFAFSIGGDITILEHYILERMMRELEAKTGRPHIKFTIRLYPNDILSTMSVIEHKLMANNICENLSDLFSANPDVDIVLIIWNYKIPLIAMKPVARAFWNEVTTNISPYLEKQGRCFVVIWSNVGTGRHVLDEVITISTPLEFVVTDLLPWFRGQLKQLEIEDDVIEQYLHQLKNQQGHLIGTYQEMQGIIKELKGGVTLYE